ncbi:hypothetical protein BDF22DRAFT_774456 [Syncephalis plumigaleata]|nr:hypothetical protein BDF22DRAFT_774456 [Syncephalis plumigaleata]
MGRKHTEREALESLPLPNEHCQNLHDVVFPNGNTGICTLPPRFRNVIWVKRGHYVLVDTSQVAQRDNKLTGEITHVLQAAQVRYIKQQGLWPEAFTNEATETSTATIEQSTKEDSDNDDDDDLFVNTNRRLAVDEVTSSEEESD